MSDSEWPLLDDVFVRRANFKDAACLAEIHAQSFAPGWDVHYFEENLPKESFIVLNAAGCRSAQIFGFVVARHIEDEAEILTICVAPGLRRHGLGKMLLTRLIAALASGFVKRVFLEVAENNVAAQSLYHQLGFVLIGRRKGYYPASVGQVRQDCLNFRLLIGPK